MSQNVGRISPPFIEEQLSMEPLFTSKCQKKKKEVHIFLFDSLD